MFNCCLKLFEKLFCFKISIEYFFKFKREKKYFFNFASITFIFVLQHKIIPENTLEMQLEYPLLKSQIAPPPPTRYAQGVCWILEINGLAI